MALTKSLSFSLRRKRVLISENNSDLEQFCGEFQCFTPMKKLCSSQNNLKNDSFSINLLETLPLELLIKIICGVHHEDLKQLIYVSKTIRDAAIIAKNCHFAYSTPLKTKAFRNTKIGLLNDNVQNSTEFEPPNAPKQVRKMNRTRLDRKTLGRIAVALFVEKTGVTAEQKWSRRSLFLDIDS
ncbi:hypothetical protein vseg_017439 [Gypsophila vaccaria]